MKKSTIAIVAGTSAVLVLGGTAFGISAASNTVTIYVDGETHKVRTFGNEVGDALDAKGIEIGPHDQVVPSIDSPIKDGTEISVRYGRQVTAIIDGKEVVIWTTAETVDDALDQLGISDPLTRLSVDRATPLGREGLTLIATTPKNVKVTVDGNTLGEKVTAEDVADVLEELNISVSATDQVVPAVDTKVTEGLEIQVKRVVVTTETKTVAVKPEVVETKSADMYVGESKTTKEGKDGSNRETWEITTVDGEVTSRELLSTEVITAPVAKHVTVGSKKRPVADVTDGSVWDRLAQCESSGNWSQNSGNGFYGGLQFTRQTWLFFGGDKYAPTANLATREQQIEIAQKVQKGQGWGAWPACSRRLGLR